MRVEVTQEVNVVVTAGVHRVYQPGIYVAAEALVVQIEKQGKGKRLADPVDAPIEAPAAGAAP